MPQQSIPLKILFFSMDGQGHLNACLGLAQTLAARGHRITFLLNETYKGEVARYGFEEFLLRKSSTKLATDMMLEEDEDGDEEEFYQTNPMKQLAKKRKAVGLFSAKTPLQKLQSQSSASTLLQDMFDSLVEYHSQMGFAIARLSPDLILLDHFLIPPAILLSEIPWVYLFSLNPLGLHNSKLLPPFGSGYSVESNTSLWRHHKWLVQQKYNKVLASYQKKLYERFHYQPACGEESVQHGLFYQSPYLNVYGYPRALDYEDIDPLDAHYARVDAFAYKSPEKFILPADFLQPGEKLIYVSLGSMASIDVDLMKRLTCVLGKSRHRYVVSKGPRSEEYTLPDNCWGAPFLPQTAILPLVDLVVSHGGNNTVTETFVHGKPMICLPLFADQYDNAQRIADKGFGIRLEPYSFTETELLEAIEELLTNESVKERMEEAAREIQVTKSKDRVCQQMEDIVQRLKY